MPPISTPSTSSDDDNRSIPAVRTHSSNTFNRRRIAQRTGGIKEYITVGNVLAVLLIIPLTFTYIKVMITGPAPSPGSNIHTIYSPVTITSTIYTPSSTAISNRHSHGNSHDPSANPWPNFTYEILASSSRKSLALNSGRVTLAGPRSGKNPGVRWKCVEIKGWLHFQNAASGCFLGHNFWGDIVCTATAPDGWERFTTRPIPEGGHYLLMIHWERLWKVGIKGGVLAKIGEGETGGFAYSGEGEGEVIAWEFFRV
ncbi:hypothetical protein BCIN_01g05620 [Botrytis cinerea B05.10]|uniref:Uncharacterized protein n=2 Tax=Botryotinia fuckeliana TaxID=40559 RepID=A0A384J5H1_BOTFB|nr:hypothetical protein BCIN_01g05620 [Botrytis cinerea B05.10]ATZ45858.1 hypothetical protein BCIN_01g05620 [Botrytis cinerea B05.10]CCD45516.1 hypothetical protein BofuT4_P045340.1 [Botrytis cinerea T4]